MHNIRPLRTGAQGGAQPAHGTVLLQLCIVDQSRVDRSAWRLQDIVAPQKIVLDERTDLVSVGRSTSEVDPDCLHFVMKSSHK